MAVTHAAAPGRATDEVRICKIGLGDLRLALSRGWDDFMAKRGDIAFAGFIYFGLMVLAAIYARNESILPLIFPVLAGALMFGPAFASGFYELARRRERGLDTRWRHFFDAARGPNRQAIIGLTALVFLLFLAWLVAAWFIYMATLGTIEPAGPWSFGRFVGAVFRTPQGLEMAVIGNLVGLCFAAVVLALSVVSFPMLIDREVTLEMAMRTSIRVTMANPGPIAAWGLIVVFLLVLGSIPAFVGLAVVLPVLGYATWHLYRCTVARSDVPPVEGEPAA